jgi:protein ImuB
MLWVALSCHRLALDVFLRASEGAEPPAAVCDRLRLLQVSDAAAALGLQPGMKRATALALAPALVLLERDGAAEAQALEQVAGWALQFTPSVSLQPPTGVLLEVAPSLQLFGGRDRLLARLRHGLDDLGFRVRVGTAPTACGAWLMACWQDGGNIEHESQLGARLGPMPLELMASAASQLDQLAAIGVRRLADLARLPRTGLARRFGKALLSELDMALGHLPEPRRWFAAPARFESRLELLAQVEQAEALLFACRRMLLQLCGWLCSHHAALREALFTGEHDSGRHGHEATRITLRLAQPSRDPERLIAVLRERLATVRLPAPVHTLRLECNAIAPLSGTHGELFPVPASGAENLARLLERLQARLGREQVQRLATAADHRPEAAFRLETLEQSETPGGPAATVAPALPGLPRPLWLLPQPRALPERDQRPWWQGPLTILAGPERIESGWWDGNLVQRDYFIAESETAGWLWIYRVRPTDARSGWYLQGVFG